MNEVLDYIYRQQLSCPISKLDWNEPAHRPWARRWLRIRDRVMGEVWSMHSARSGGGKITIRAQPPPIQKPRPPHVKIREVDPEKERRDIREGCKKAREKGGMPAVLKRKFPQIISINSKNNKYVISKYRKGTITIEIPWYYKT
ncbi:MAG: hypothetical protein ACMUJM_18570 [bacterium]